LGAADRTTAVGGSCDEQRVYSQPSGQMRCGWTVGGIFENQFAAQVSMN